MVGDASAKPELLFFQPVPPKMHHPSLITKNVLNEDQKPLDKDINWLKEFELD